MLLLVFSRKPCGHCLKFVNSFPTGANPRVGGIAAGSLKRDGRREIKLPAPERRSRGYLLAMRLATLLLLRPHR